MAKDSPNGAVEVLPPANELLARQKFQQMATIIPVTESDGGFGIVLDILSADDLFDLDQTWQEKDLDKLLKRKLVFDSVTRSDSSYQDGLGVFLVVRCTDPENGEEVVFSTGSVNIVAQLVKAHVMGAFPFVGRVIQAEKASANGYYPQHIQIEDDQSLVGKANRSKGR